MAGAWQPPNEEVQLLKSLVPQPRRRARWAALVALAALLPMLLPSTQATAGYHPSAPKPTIVLVHGAWADGSSWDAVTQRFQRAGYPVRVPPNPLRNLLTDAETISDFLSTLSGPIVLVGHSYGGAVITNAATGNANVKALVYVDAFAPAEGETVFPLVGADSVLAGDPATVFDFVPYPGAPAGRRGSLPAEEPFPDVVLRGRAAGQSTGPVCGPTADRLQRGQRAVRRSGVGDHTVLVRARYPGQSDHADGSAEHG